MGRRSDRIKAALDCANCGRRNYWVTKNKKTTPHSLVFKKFCAECNAHTTHQEGK